MLDRTAGGRVFFKPGYDPVDPLAKSEHEDPEVRRARNAKPSNRAARREYMHTQAGHEANRKAQDNYKERHPERVAAQHAARSEHGDSGGSGHKCKCGKAATHKHHPDYKDKTKVAWLCHSCHVKEHHPKSNLGEKTEKAMNDFSRLDDLTTLRKGLSDGGDGSGANWFQQYAGTPFYAEAIALEQKHIDHELERRSKQKAASAAAAERNKKYEAMREANRKLYDQQAKEELKQDQVWAWDDRFYADQRASVAALRKKYLGWLQKEATPSLVKSLAARTRDGFVASQSRSVSVSPPYSPERTEDTRMADSKTLFPTDLFDALMKRDLRAEMKKSITIEHERPGVHAEGMPAVGGVINPNMSAVAMADHARPGGSDQTTKAIDPKKPCTDDEVAEMDKAMIEGNVGPNMSGDSLGATRTEHPGAIATPANAAQQVSPGDSQGMPNVQHVQDVILSADDALMENQLQPRRMPLDEMVPPWSPPQLADSAGTAGVAMFKSQVASYPQGHHGFMPLGPSSEPGPSPRAQAGAGQSQPAFFRMGSVMISTGFDQSLSKAMTVGHGGVFGMMYQDGAVDLNAPLMQNRQCRCCQKSVPTFLAGCPSCGDNPNGMQIDPSQMLQKAMGSAGLATPPVQLGRLHFPNGVMPIPAE